MHASGTKPFYLNAMQSDGWDTFSSISLWRKMENETFFPRAFDYSDVDKIDIIVKLPLTKMIGETSWSMEYFSFDVVTSKYNVR